MIEKLNFCSIYGKQGSRGPFQDSLVAWEGFMEQRGCIMAGVFDGHGNLGKQMSTMIRDTLPITLAESLEKVLEEDDSPVDFCHAAGEAMLRSFKLMERKIVTEFKMKAATSGSTAVTALIQAGQLLVANLGDSRCVLATTGPDHKLHSVQITEDLKPTVPGEYSRIVSRNGRIVSFPGDPPIDRLVHPEVGGMGLAVSRCFGDTMLKKFGLSAEPQLLYHRIRPEDKFLILASDGLWEVMSNDEAVKTVASAVSKKKAAEVLVEKASQMWQQKKPTSQKDDISVVVIKLEGLSSRLLQKLVSLKKSNPSIWKRFITPWKVKSNSSSSGPISPSSLAVVVTENVCEEEDLFPRSLSASNSESLRSLPFDDYHNPSI